MTVLDIVKHAIGIGSFAFVALFLIAIPAYIFKKSKANKDYDADIAWGQRCWWNIRVPPPLHGAHLL